MKLERLSPAVITTIWGGKKLFSYGKESKEDSISETWELSFYKEHPSLLDSGEHVGKPLFEVATTNDLGTNVSKFDIFPLLIKFIDSEQDLSIQVHPSDEFALQNEHELGKTEMWHILESDEKSGIYLGFCRDTTENEVKAKVEDGTIVDLLNFIEVKPGDTFFIPAGTVHAIGKGVTLIEIQQNSNITYRLYDYKRIDKNGKMRELHLDKALQVLNFKAGTTPSFKEPLLGQCKYFSAYKYKVSQNKIVAESTSFKAISFVSGSGHIDNFEYKAGDTFFLPASQTCEVRGNGEMVITEVPSLC